MPNQVPKDVWGGGAAGRAAHLAEGAGYAEVELRQQGGCLQGIGVGTQGTYAFSQQLTKYGFWRHFRETTRAEWILGL